MTPKDFSIYIHIPICVSRCNYCNFITYDDSLHLIDSYVTALCTEISIAAETFCLKERPCTSIYLGGGTPSLLNKFQLRQIFNALNNSVYLDDSAEITLEANPQDITKTVLVSFHEVGINRLSIGCQSFQDEYLQFLSRRHSADEGRKAIELSRQAGFSNISIDLIFNIPGQTLKLWNKDLEEASLFSPEHISLYNLTIEPGTPLNEQFRKGYFQLPSDSISEEIYTSADKYLVNSGYHHYEISNFACAGFYSRHNINYWSGNQYFGLGAGAHSYDGKRRFWNKETLKEYIESVRKGVLPEAKSEILTPEQKYLERVMLELRTEAGLDLSTLESGYRMRIIKNMKKLTLSDEEPVIEMHDEQLMIPRHKWIIADEIIARLVL